MTALVRPTEVAGPASLVEPGSGRRWWAGWRVALRMAWRDIGRDRGRSLFVWLMITIPVAAFAGSQVILASQDISVSEHLDLRLGAAHTRLTYQGFPFTPDVDTYRQAVAPADLGSSPEDELAPTLPGWGTAMAEREAAVTAHTGQSALGFRLRSSLTGASGDGDSIVVLGMDTARPEAAGTVQLTSGRFPTAPDEVLVTAAGSAFGLPISGPVQLRPDELTPTTWQVVGTVDVRFDQVVYLITLPDAINGELGFLLSGAGTTTWADAERLAQLGFETTSRGIAANPPADSAGTGTSSSIYYGGLFGAGALLQVGLLVGPAFAIGANRQRRSLALAACNGATVRQLRRAALSQAVLLGLTAALTGTLGGTLLGVAAWPLVSADPLTVHGPLEIPLPFLTAILALGAVTAMLAALVPARGLGRLDVVAALRGSTRPPLPARGSGLLRGGLGVACLAAGAGLPWLSVAGVEDPTALNFLAWVAAVVLAGTGVLLLTPTLLLGLARVAGRGPVSWRLALRDLGRNRGRATAVVAAIMGGSMILGSVWTMIVSIDADIERMYEPQLPYGQGELWASPVTAQALRSIDETLQVAEVTTVAGRQGGDDWRDASQLIARRPGCPDDILRGYEDPACQSLGSDGRTILVAPLDTLTWLFGLDQSHVDALAAGRLLVDTTPYTNVYGTTVTQLVNGNLELLYSPDGDEPQTHSLTIPASTVTGDLIDHGSARARTAALATPDIANAYGLALHDWSLRVINPAGPITFDQESRINRAINNPNWPLQVERGYQPTPQPVVWAVTTTLALLAVVAAAMATILAATELRPFHTTLTAVGANPALNSRLAMAQAATLALLGTALGFSIGILTGIPLALSSTEKRPWGEPLVIVPWPTASLFLIGVPLAALVVAAIASPSRPTLGKRNT